jgi:hypothetical protein
MGLIDEKKPESQKFCDNVPLKSASDVFSLSAMFCCSFQLFDMFYNIQLVSEMHNPLLSVRTYFLNMNMCCLHKR